MSSCVLDEQNFRRCCRLLLQQSEVLKDDWSWEAVPGEEGSEEGYLRKTTLRPVVVERVGSSSGSEPHTSGPVRPHPQGQEKERSVPIALVDADCTKGDDDDDDDDEEDDGVCMVSEGSSQVLQYEYHILYSCSYGVPVLYFRASTLAGRSLSLEEVWSNVHPSFRCRLQGSPLNTISLQEHPLLGQPFFVLHPCRTEEFMAPVLWAARDQRRPVNYVLSWLSVVGPLVGLDVPLKYSAQVDPAAPHHGNEPD